MHGRYSRRLNPRSDGGACAMQESTLLQHTFTSGRAGPRPAPVVPQAVCVHSSKAVQNAYTMFECTPSLPCLHHVSPEQSPASQQCPRACMQGQLGELARRM